jgi:alanine dehydrogenase
MLIIDNATVAQLLTMDDCIRVQEVAFRKVPSGEAIHRPRIDMYFPCEREDGYFRWGTMEGANDEYFAIRMKSDIVTWPRDSNGNWTEDKYCVTPGRYCGLILLISTRNGEPLAFINDGVLQHMRVGGSAGLGAKYLARDDAHVVGMLGSGGMARSYLEAFTCVRPITTCRVFSPTPSHREAFAQEMSAKLGIDVQAVATAREAVMGADIFASCTDAMNPVYEAEWVEPGMHVEHLNENELPPDVFDRLDVVIRQGESGLQLAENERILSGVGQSPIAFVGGTAEQMKRLPERVARTAPLPKSPSFADLASGRSAGRTSRDQVTFYLHGGQGLQFSSVGGWVYSLARSRNLGREIPTSWFLQDIRD